MARTATGTTVLARAAAAGPGPRAGRSGVTVQSSPSLRLTRRGRLAVLGGALAVIAGLGVGGVGVMSAEAGQPGAAVVLAEHTVAPGETLWHIARTAAAAGEDVRDVVAELQRLNGLQDSTVVVGQQILVPAR